MNIEKEVQQIDVEIEAAEHAINGALAIDEHEVLVKAVMQLQEKRKHLTEEVD